MKTEPTTEYSRGRMEPSAPMAWRILSIDDDPLVHQTYQTILDDHMERRFHDLIGLLEGGEATSAVGNERQFLLDHAMGGEEGVKYVQEALKQKDPYAVILLDMRMPAGWDGMKTAEMIRRIDREVRIVLITAFMDYELEEVRQRIGFNFEFLKKPVDSNELTQLTLSLASGWSQHRELLATRQALEQAQAKLEQKVEQRTRELRSSREESEQILEVMDEGLIVLDSNGLIERVNPKLQQMSGKSAEQLIGSSVHALFTDSATPLLHGQRFLHGQEGEVIPVEVSGALLHQQNRADEMGQGAVLVVHDLTDRLHAEEQQRNSQAKDRFIASVSHELRTPLTTIIGNSELLSQAIEQQLDPEQSKMLRLIEMSGRTQLALVNDILDLSKIEAGKFEIDESEFDLRTLLEELSHIFQQRAEESGLRFLIQQPDLERQLCGDGRRVTQVLTNLLSNAIKFTEQGGVSLKVWIDDADEKLHFLVEDSGIGMTADVVARLFQPYEQADHTISVRYGGTGLGLHVSNTLAELMGGEITVESDVGLGSRFCLTIPYRPGESPVLQQDPERMLEECYFSGRVLVAEDTPELQLLEQRLLQWHGVEVTVVNNGREAISMVSAQPFDLILMDMQMPEMDGIEATRRLRQDGVDLPVIALTANVMQQHREQFMEAGCDAFLEKPIDRVALCALLKRYLPEQEVAELPQADEDAMAFSMLDGELMALFAERIGALLRQLKEAHAEREWEDVRTIAHTVKGTGATFGYPDLTRLGQEVMQLVDQELHVSLPQRVEQLIRIMEQIVIAPAAATV